MLFLWEEAVMSFDVVCSNCGAPSAPSVGVCPFCKAVLTSEGATKSPPAITEINKFFNDGKIGMALALAQAAEKNKPSLLKNIRFVLLYVKILLETSGPSSKIKSLLSQALLEHPGNSNLIEYLEIIDARSNFSREKNDMGEIELANIIRRSPKNVHALFLLGSHLFWVEKDLQKSLVYLERCYRLRPNFLRASACLAALYKSVGLNAQASRLFKQCARLERNREMKTYFKHLASK